MKISRILIPGCASLVLLALAGCSALRPAPAFTQAAPSAQGQPNTGIQYHFVTNQLLLPTTQSQAEEFALNVDGDPGKSGDNHFGRLLSLLTSAAPGLELQATLDDAVDTGKLISLHVLNADDPLNDPSASWSIVLGHETGSAPAFDGSDEFTIAPGDVVNEPIVGTLSAGHFSGGPGAAQARIFLFGHAVDVSLLGVRLEADVNAQGCTNGRLGGGVSVDEFRGKLLPIIADGLNEVLLANPDASKLVLQAFDSDGNGSISVEELEGNPLLMLAISPDMDLLDASGAFNPRQDGEKDSYSAGFGFTCVPATFEAPGN
jgi:hypothetical protein